MHMLIATDGKPHSENAIRFAGNLFQNVKPTVTVLHVHPSKKAEESKQQAKKYLDHAAKILQPFGIHPKLQLEEGSIPYEILRAVERSHVDLLVLGSRRTSSVLKSITGTILDQETKDIISSSPVSLLVVKNTPGELRRVLLCTDGSPMAEATIDYWGRLKKTHEPHVTILNIVPDILGKRFRYDVVEKSVRKQLLQAFLQSDHPNAQLLMRGKRILEKHGIEDIDIKLREREYAASEIIQEAEKGKYDLIVMGYRGAGGSRMTKPGSQSYEVLCRAPQSVFVYLPKVRKT